MSKKAVDLGLELIEAAVMIKKNNVEKLKLLIEKGANVNAADEDGKTALMYAALCDAKETAELLIEKGADVNAVNDNGETALMMATKKNNKEIADLLIKTGAKQNGKRE